MEGESKTTRNVLLKGLKNLRSQVCRAGCQAVAVVFLTVGKSLEADTEALIKELLQKSADTNKFIRWDINIRRQSKIFTHLYCLLLPGQTRLRLWK